MTVSTDLSPLSVERPKRVPLRQLRRSLGRLKSIVVVLETKELTTEDWERRSDPATETIRNLWTTIAELEGWISQRKNTGADPWDDELERRGEAYP